MTDIYQNISNPSNSSYSYKSFKYWCSTCSKQFSQLSLENSLPSQARCPRCNLYADPTPQTSQPGSSSSSQPQSDNYNQRQPQQQDQEYVYYTQPVMDPFGRVYMQTYRVPANSQNQQRTARQQPRPQQQANTNNGNIFSQLFGNFFGFGGGNNYGYGAGVDESVIEEFLRNDPNNHGPAPAPQESINKLQQVKFDQHQHMDCEENKCCPVCQEDYQHGESLVRLPCGHDYHGECVKTWLTKHNSCPMCRKAI